MRDGLDLVSAMVEGSSGEVSQMGTDTPASPDALVLDPTNGSSSGLST